MIQKIPRNIIRPYSGSILAPGPSTCSEHEMANSVISEERMRHRVILDMSRTGYIMRGKFAGEFDIPVETLDDMIISPIFGGEDSNEQ
jgi:hypothetical protein